MQLRKINPLKDLYSVFYLWTSCLLEDCFDSLVNCKTKRASTLLSIAFASQLLYYNQAVSKLSIKNNCKPLPQCTVAKGE